MKFTLRDCHAVARDAIQFVISRNAFAKKVHDGESTTLDSAAKISTKRFIRFIESSDRFEEHIFLVGGNERRDDTMSDK